MSSSKVKEKSWVLSCSSGDILNSNIGPLRKDLTAFQYLDSFPTIFSNENSKNRKDVDPNSFDLLNIFGDYDSHAFPSAHDVQVKFLTFLTVQLQSYQIMSIGFNHCIFPFHFLLGGHR